MPWTRTATYITDSKLGIVRRVDATTGATTIVAGIDVPGMSGDGGPATSAQLRDPNGVAADAAGDLFIADSSNNRVRRVDATTGMITTVAGSGTAGISGDGGPATSAQLDNPTGVAVDAAGDLFIADSSNNKVRRVDATTGMITTVAGNGTAGSAGDGGPATGAQLNAPHSVALDAAGNLLIVDTGNASVRRVDATTGMITAVAGVTGRQGGATGDGGPATSAHFFTPIAVAVDQAGDLFIADAGSGQRCPRGREGDRAPYRHRRRHGHCPGTPATTARPPPPARPPEGRGGGPGRGPVHRRPVNNRVREVDGTRTSPPSPGNGTASLGDGGPAAAPSSGPRCHRRKRKPVHRRHTNNRIRKVDATTHIITTVAGNGTAVPGGDGGPATAPHLIPSGHGRRQRKPVHRRPDNNRVREVERQPASSPPSPATAAGSTGDGGPATAAELNSPSAWRWTAGNLFIADTGNQPHPQVDANRRHHHRRRQRHRGATAATADRPPPPS